MNMNNTIVDTFIEIEPLDQDSFFKVKETLTRMGLTGKKGVDGKRTLYQSAHILHKKGHYYIVHFKQLFLLDGKTRSTEFTEEDLLRTRLIADLLNKWGLIKLKKPTHVYENVTLDKCDVVIIPYKDKDKWNLKSKYTIGKNKKKYNTENEQY